MLGLWLDSVIIINITYSIQNLIQSRKNFGCIFKCMYAIAASAYTATHTFYVGVFSFLVMLLLEFHLFGTLICNCQIFICTFWNQINFVNDEMMIF